MLGGILLELEMILELLGQEGEGIYSIKPDPKKGGESKLIGAKETVFTIISSRGTIKESPTI